MNRQKRNLCNAHFLKHFHHFLTITCFHKKYNLNQINSYAINQFVAFTYSIPVRMITILLFSN